MFWYHYIYYKFFLVTANWIFEYEIFTNFHTLKLKNYNIFRLRKENKDLSCYSVTFNHLAWFLMLPYKGLNLCSYIILYYIINVYIYLCKDTENYYLLEIICSPGKMLLKNIIIIYDCQLSTFKSWIFK